MFTRAAFCSFLVLASSLLAQRVDTLRLRAEATAAALPWLEIGVVIWDREPRYGPNPDVVARGLRELKGDWSIDEIRPLLKHADPKVRTLAIALLLDLDRLDILSDIAALLADTAPTFPQPQILSATATA